MTVNSLLNILILFISLLWFHSSHMILTFGLTILLVKELVTLAPVSWLHGLGFLLEGICSPCLTNGCFCTRAWVLSCASNFPTIRNLTSAYRNPFRWRANTCLRGRKRLRGTALRSPNCSIRALSRNIGLQTKSSCPSMYVLNREGSPLKMEYYASASPGFSIRRTGISFRAILG